MNTIYCVQRVPAQCGCLLHQQIPLHYHGNSHTVKNAVVFLISFNFVTNKTFLLCVILGTIFEIFYQLHIGLYQLSLYLNSADLFFAV